MNENAKPGHGVAASIPGVKPDTPQATSKRDDARSQQPLGREALDVAVAWSIIGIFIIMMMAIIHELSLILIPVVMAIVVGMILGIAAEKLGSYGIPGSGVALILSTLVAAVIFFVINSLVDPLSLLASEGQPSSNAASIAFSLICSD